MPGPVKVKKPSSLARSKVRLDTPTGARQRYVLMAPEVTRASAKGIQTRLLKGGWTAAEHADADMTRRGEALKSSVEGMAIRLNVDEERAQKIMKMEPEKLVQLYDSNDLIFEAYFNYGGINATPSGWQVNPGQKDADVDFLIEQYERSFGPL